MILVDKHIPTFGEVFIDLLFDGNASGIFHLLINRWEATALFLAPFISIFIIFLIAKYYPERGSSGLEDTHCVLCGHLVNKTDNSVVSQFEIIHRIRC